MKSALLLIAVCLIGLAIAPGASAQTFSVPNISGTSMTDIYSAGAVLVGALEANQKEIVHIEYDIVYKGVTTTNYRMLTDRWTYTLVGFADFRVTDLDLTVYKYMDSAWVLIGQDQLTDKLPTITISPLVTGLYRFDISAYSFNEPFTSGHYGFIIFHVHPDAENTAPVTDPSSR